jgi:imidazolonepropionase-like amidohydrolase
MREAGLPMGYGSDLLGQLQKYQTMEFELRSRVLPMQEVLQSATTTAAKLCRMDGEIGALVPGAHADLLVVDGDPLSDPQLFQNDGRALRAIMRGGQFFKNELH